MEVKLCYKTYPVEMTLGAMKKFTDATGQDLWVTLLKLLNENELCKDGETSILQRMIRLTELVPFEVAANIFYSMIDKSLHVSLEEIRDGMARVGWLPTERDGDMGEPYAFVLLQLAYDVNAHMESAIKETKKKADS